MKEYQPEIMTEDDLELISNDATSIFADKNEASDELAHIAQIEQEEGLQF